MTEPQNVQAPDPLAMANNLTEAIREMSAKSAEDPLLSVTQRLGERAASHGRMAAELALVSIARDLRRIADHLTGADS